MSLIGTLQKTSETLQVTLVELQEKTTTQERVLEAMVAAQQEELEQTKVAIKELRQERKASYTGGTWSMYSMDKDEASKERGGGDSIGYTVMPLIKMEFPPYDGSTDADEWLQKCDDYFDYYRVFNDDAKVRQAMFVLTGRAFNWSNNLRRLVTHRLSWAEFKRFCKSRFGRVDAVNPLIELFNLRHTGTVDEYCNQFEECVGRQTRLTGDYLVWQFCVGLTDNLRREVEYLRPETIFEAMEYARENEYKIDGDKRTRTFGGYLAPQRL